MLSLLSNPRFLAIYSGCLTFTFVLTVLWGAASLRSASFDVITARRINIVEPDGTLRLAISDRAEFPGTPMHGKEYQRPDRTEAAGLLFVNDEGTEMGGLIWGGFRGKDGHVESHGHLSFDQYDQNQVFAIDAGREGADKFSAIEISQRGDWPMQERFEAGKRISRLPADQQDAAWQRFNKTHPGNAQRIYLGWASDGSAMLKMKDSNGRDRLTLGVGADGDARIQFLDAKGQVASQFPAEAR